MSAAAPLYFPAFIVRESCCRVLAMRMLLVADHIDFTHLAVSTTASPTPTPRSRQAIKTRLSQRLRSLVAVRPARTHTAATTPNAGVLSLVAYFTFDRFHRARKPPAATFTALRVPFSCRKLPAQAATADAGSSRARPPRRAADTYVVNLVGPRVTGRPAHRSALAAHRPRGTRLAIVVRGAIGKPPSGA